MELILISDRKLKIMLSQKDMAKYSLKTEDIDYDNTTTKRAFLSILDEAKQKTGFDASNDKLYIQIFPCRAGGCEIFITKLSDSADTECLSADLKKHDRIIYRFTDLKHLLKVCSILEEQAYSGESSAYRNSCYYFLCLNKSHDFIDEYADMRINKNYIYHILEHFDRICAKDAVETLAPLC